MWTVNGECPASSKQVYKTLDFLYIQQKAVTTLLNEGQAHTELATKQISFL